MIRKSNFQIDCKCIGVLLLAFALALVFASVAAAKPKCDNPPCNDDGGSPGGEEIPLKCWLIDDEGDTILSDDLGIYVDDVDKVSCLTFSTRLTLDSMVRGQLKNAVRKFDLAIAEGTCTEPEGCAAVPDGVFTEAGGLLEEMEDLAINVQVYPGTSIIQNLDTGFYEVVLGFGLKGFAERWVFQMMSQPIPDEFHQGVHCDLDNPADAISEDVTLYVWPDNDSDGVPDGYTVTTAVEENINIGSLPPVISDSAPRLATLCSNVGADGSTCGGPGNSNLCHLISKMEVQFTWHAENQ